MNDKVYLLYRCRDYDQSVLGVYSTQQQAVAEGNRTISHWGLKGFSGQEWKRDKASPGVWMKQNKNAEPGDMYFLVICRFLNQKVSL